MIGLKAVEKFGRDHYYGVILLLLILSKVRIRCLAHHGFPWGGSKTSCAAGRNCFQFLLLQHDFPSIMVFRGLCVFKFTRWKESEGLVLLRWFSKKE